MMSIIDTIVDAVAISLPHAGGGTTVGYTDDYDEVCPYSGSTSPDVVYTFTVETTMAIDVDLNGSSYDTKIYLYDAALELVACNDDDYPDYTSRLEGEPPLEPDYIDCYNNGCQTSVCDGVPTWAFQVLDGGLDGELIFHGRSGWYPSVPGGSRDADYLIAFLGDAGVMEITMDAEFATYLLDRSSWPRHDLIHCKNIGYPDHQRHATGHTPAIPWLAAARTSAV